MDLVQKSCRIKILVLIMSKQYKIISENDVVNILLRTSENWQGCGIISPSNITYLLETSKYQVNKYIKSLKFYHIKVGNKLDSYSRHSALLLIL